jgi:hypothetical protein
MSVENIKVKYTGSALPGNAETVSIFSTVVAFPGQGMIQSMEIHRLYLTLVNDQAGTLKSYSSENRGVTWTQISSTAVAIASANTDQPYDYLIDPYTDWKLDWVNGATPQTSFRVAASLQGDRTPAA